MRRNEWDDKKIEQRLSELPKMKDEQGKEALFKAIQERMGEMEQTKEYGRKKASKKRQWFYPTLASACALFLLILIIPTFIGDNEQSIGDLEEKNEGITMDMVTEDAKLTVENDMDHFEQSNFEESDFEPEFSISKSENEEMDIVDEKAEEHDNNLNFVAIPYVEDIQMNDVISLKVMIEYVEKKVLGENVDELEKIILYSLAAKDIDESVKIDDLNNIEVDEDVNEVTLDFKEDNRLLSLSSGEEGIFRETILEVLGIYGFERVHFSMDGVPGIVIGQTGEAEYTWDLPYKNRGYYLYENKEGEQFAVRGVAIGAWTLDEGELTLLETLEKMKSVEEDAWYKSFIPENVYFDDAFIEGNEAIVTIDEQSQLDDEDIKMLVQGIIFAATDFSVDYVTIHGEPFELVHFIKTEKIPVKPIFQFKDEE